MKIIPTHLWHWVGILTVLCLVQFPIGESLIWDDELLIGLNPWTQDWNGLVYSWTHHLWADIPGEHLTHWYRPLMGTHLVVDQQTFGAEIKPRQWLNLVWLFFATGLLIEWMILRFNLSPQKALLAGLLLSSSHLTTEFIHFTAARNDTMALAFALLASIASLKQRPSWMVGLFSLMSLCSKESGLLLLILLHAVSNQSSIRQYTSSLIFPLVLWSVLRWFAIEQHTNPNIHVDWSTLLQSMMSVPFYWIQVSPSALIPLEEHPLWPISLLGLGGLFIYKRASMKNLGLIILFGSFGYTVLTFNQSLLGGFRYLYISYIVGIVLLMTQCKAVWIWFVGSILLCFNVANTLHTKKQWTNNRSLWETAYMQTPTPQVACGSFMQLRTDPMVATVRLSKALEPPIMTHCCAQASRYPIELNNPELAIELGTKALQNGCPDIAELLAPLALAYAIQQEWKKSEQVLNKVESDPFGYKPVIETAIGLRKNNLGPLNDWALRSQDKYPDMTLDTIKNELRTRAEALFKEDSSQEN